MYKIKRTDKPNFGLLREELEKSIKKGIKLGDISERYQECMEQLETDRMIIARDYGVANPNSTKQVAGYLETLADNGDSDVYDICYQNGKYITDKEALGKLADRGSNFANDMLNYRTNKKICETLSGLIEAAVDGCIRPNIQISKTNRINYVSPALMNIPKKLIWKVIVARDETKQLISVDIKNQEPCILINMLNIEKLKFALKDERGLYESIFSEIYKPKTWLYLHNYTEGLSGVIDNSILSDMGYSRNILNPILPSATTTYYKGRRVYSISVANTFVDKQGNAKIPQKVIITTEASEEDSTDYIPRYGLVRREEVDVQWEVKNIETVEEGRLKKLPGTVKDLDVLCIDESRKQFKRCWNALNYGGSHMIVEETCKDIDGDLLYDYFNSISELNKFKDYCKKKARNHDTKIQTYFGTEVETDSFGTTFRLQRSLRDLPIQGTGADILALLVEHFNNEIEARELQGKLGLYFTRHDEIVVEANKNWIASIGKAGVKEILNDIFEHQIDDWSPFRVEIDFLTNEEETVYE